MLKEQQAADQSSVTIVVVTYGAANLVRRCITAALAAASEVGELSVVVSDNASPDDTIEMLRRDFPGVTVLASTTNNGFAVANNRALRAISTDYALLLNPDCILHPGTLGSAVNRIGETGAGMLGVRLLQGNGTFDHASKRSIPTPKSAAQYFSGRRNSKYLTPDLPEEASGDVEAINGAFMLVDRRAMMEVGLLDEQFWMYAEDLDWCLRFRQAGWHVLYAGDITATHLKSEISGRARSAKLNWHFHRSMDIFYRKHSRNGNIAMDGLVFAAIYGRMVWKIARDGLVRQVEKRRATVDEGEPAT